MPPRVNLAALRVMEVVVVAHAAQKKKKPAVDPSQYKLRRLRKVPQLEARVDVETARVKVETAPVARESISLRIPLTRGSAKSPQVPSGRARG